jgi:cell wall-associated NlpC family hydrolase
MSRNPRSIKMIAIGVMGMLGWCLTACEQGESHKPTTPPQSETEVKTGAAGEDWCPLGAAIETDGIRRLALVVGVGQYRNERVPDLIGPPNDARRFFELLTDSNGYGFPRENVCLLLDEQATTAEFKRVFDKALVERARAQDVAVVFYAGHGSMRRDKNGDEPDGLDETLMLHDARSDGVRDLVDDEFHEMLQQLHANTGNITVVLDSCNAGTATRGDAGTFVARFFEPADEDLSVTTAAAAASGDASWVPEALPGVVVLTAATDGTPALETNGRGIFTDALIQVLAQAGDQPLTYAQLARQVPPLVAANSYQIPYFHGDLNEPVFGNEGRTRPVAWEVARVGPPLELSGPPLPGIGEGAELRIYDGAVSGADTRDPGKAKATAIIDSMTGLNATARVSPTRPEASLPEAGDLAVLVRPADAYLGIRVRLRPATEPGGIPSERAAALNEAIEANAETEMLVELTQDAGDFELSVDADQRLVLRGPENRIRNVYDEDSEVADNLWQHARQLALLQLRGEGGADFTDHQTLQVQLVPAPRQTQCADGIWEQAPPNSEQLIPLCHAWNVKVTLSKDAPMPLLVGGVIFSTDGNSFGFPADGRKVALKPGEAVVFNSRLETFIGTPPLDVQDHVMVFGTQESNPVQWHLLTNTAATRAAGPPMTGLYRALDLYLQPGTRGTARLEEVVEDTTWTLSALTSRVEANQRFVKADRGVTEPPVRREYTIANFDIRPYLPDDPTTALHRVLQQADALANASATDGYGYKQHDWSLSTEEENLKRGIDCSRSIWFAFTRAGLPYNSGDRYLTTAMMVGDDSPMAEQFEDCSAELLQPGDVVVYRDDTRGDGHVVMVIDPAKRIAWGSHGWDGNAKALSVEPDTGVEYQLIKFKQDWERWDRRTMARQACWRYRAFSEEASTPRGQPGLRALADACDPRKRCGSQEE